MSTSRPAPALLGLLCAAALGLAGCRGGADVPPPEETPTPGAPAAPAPGGAEPGAPAAPNGSDSTGELRDLMLSSLTATATSAQMDRALEALDVEAFRLDVADREVWFALSTGSGVWELPEAGHVAGVYEHRADGSWVEIARLVLESAPTVASAEVVPIPVQGGLPIWIAVSGTTGAHSGTFDLLRWDGTHLTSDLWWFSPSPGAAQISDLDGDGTPEIVLNASDPYVFCYACGVVDYSEVVYRWVDGEPTLIDIGAIEGETEIAALTAHVARLVEADLWSRAQTTIESALAVAPTNEVVAWDYRLVRRIASERLAQAGSPQQPLLTFVLAGEYAQAAALMAALPPEQVFDRAGPLIEGTQAVGWEEAMGLYLIDYATRALAMDGSLHEAHAVRALGHLLVRPDAWADALIEMDAALELQPGNAFYQAAVAYLLEQAGGTRG